MKLNKKQKKSTKEKKSNTAVDAMNFWPKTQKPITCNI